MLDVKIVHKDEHDNTQRLKCAFLAKDQSAEWISKIQSLVEDTFVQGTPQQ